ncbi:FAD-dependent oxidoreductase [Kitasatospora cinereorecta]|uniref:FAD-dependent oxidoreductase n=1 Tax=Kitasatospora cinereorecta TaxID=285560 RepID=A0ABW0VC79_9ACTN
MSGEDGSGGARHAVVVGAGIAGLLAARVLTESFARVTVLDRDALPAEAGPRRGVPQSRHAHGLLARGFAVLQELFPGLADDLVARGALVRDANADVKWFSEGRRLSPTASDLACLLVSRPELEHYLRSRVTALPGVTIEDRCEVLEPVLAAGSTTRVAGVQVLRHGASQPQSLPAELVVDATGRGNRGPVWLKAMGFAAPAEERIDSGLVYASRDYRRQPGDADADAYLIAATAEVPRGGVALSGEGDRWLVTLFSMDGEAPPSDPATYLGFAGRLPVPDLHGLLERWEPLGPPTLMRIPASIRRRYERLNRFPEGYLVIGDAICQFNPTYGQGMTVAACEALALRDSLAEGAGPDLAKRFFRRAARITDVAWDMSVGGDLRFPSVEGRRTARVRLLNRYVARVNRVAVDDPQVALTFLRVAHLQAPPQDLLSPAMLRRVLRPVRTATVS